MEYSVPGARPDTTKSGRTERVRLRTSPPPPPSLTSRRKDWGRPPSKPGWHVTRRPSMDPFEMRQSCGGDGGTANKENRFEYGEGNLLSIWLRSDLCLDKPAVLRPPMRCNPKQLMQRDILPSCNRAHISPMELTQAQERYGLTEERERPRQNKRR